jgi:hypothetical protein
MVGHSGITWATDKFLLKYFKLEYSRNVGMEFLLSDANSTEEFPSPPISIISSRDKYFFSPMYTR